MPTLDFKGKNHIYAHHLTVPYRPLQLDASRSMLASSQNGDIPLTDQNLIIHGDNLHALKALLPHYAGRVKCIYIDPPYNTGSQEWVYNDRVNSPMIRAWLQENKPVESEDLERHDKWLCMMWPRLQLLRELLSDDGAIFISIDDHEQWRLLGMLEDIFGEKQFVATLTLVHFLSALPGKWLTTVTEYVHVFAKNIDHVTFARLATDEDPKSDWEEDEVGYYKEGYGLQKTGSGAKREDRPNLFFPIYVSEEQEIRLTREHKNDVELLPIRSDGSEGRWRWSREKIKDNSSEILVKPHRTKRFQLIAKQRPNIGDVFTVTPRSLWYKPQYQSSSGTNMLRSIFGTTGTFDYPKAMPFVSDIIRFANVGPNDIVLDSFAGSGTTAHAALALNKEDGGNRRFILVECEDYADSITAERVRRVISGVPNAKDKQLRDGLGGSFAYCTLGEAIDVDSLLEGETLPSFADLANYLLHTATGISASPGDLQSSDDDGHFYSSDTQDYYLIYEPSLEFLRSGNAALNLERAERIREKGRPAVVFAAATYISQSALSKWRITFCQLPYELGFGG